MPTTLATIDGALKDLYTKFLTDQVNIASPLLDYFKQLTGEDVQWEGRAAVEATKLRLNEGVGVASEDKNLPTAGSTTLGQFRIPMRHLYGSIRLTEQSIKAMKTSKGAYANALDLEMESIVDNLQREVGRYLAGSGVGVLALVNGAVSASATVIVDAPGNIAGTVGGARYLRPGMIIGFLDAAGTALEDKGTISSINAAGTTLTMAAVATITDNARIVRLNTATGTDIGETGFNNEPEGLLAMVDDTTFVTTYHALSRTTNPILKSRVHAAVGALTLDNIQQNFDITNQQAASGPRERVSVLCAHHSVRRAYAALLEADRRYSGADLIAPDGGTKVVKQGSYLTFGNVPIIEDRNLPYGMLFGLNSNHFRQYAQVDGEWAEDDKGAVLRQVTGKDVWEAFYRRWFNWHNAKSIGSFRMEGITATAAYVPSL